MVDTLRALHEWRALALACLGHCGRDWDVLGRAVALPSPHDPHLSPLAHMCRYGPIGDNPFDGVEGGEGGEPGSFDTAAPATPGSTGPSPSPTGRGTATSPQPFPQPPAGTHSPHALSPRASFSGSPVPGGASLVPQPPSAPKGAGAGASSSGGSVTGAGASGGGAGAGGGAGGSGYAWNPDARPMPSRLKNSSSSLSPSAALDAVLAEQVGLSTHGLGVSQWTALLLGYGVHAFTPSRPLLPFACDLAECTNRPPTHSAPHLVLPTMLHAGRPQRNSAAHGRGAQARPVQRGDAGQGRGG